ncbi:unnamed protein product [Soboliphyme baturini]|uniref:PITH domain-containing protein n=1 Tax=Soboliphyme baturini TaxID=241478 RepID=A0A183I9T6_9BILA|nr:unnamed protein product [Soboliphyme baturini]
MANVDNEKAFQIVEYKAVSAEQDIDTYYINLPKEANSGGFTNIALLDTPLPDSGREGSSAEGSGESIEEVDKYIYLSHVINMGMIRPEKFN